MTRLDVMRALMALPAEDNHRRSFSPIDGYEKADPELVTIKTKRKASKKSKRTSSRIGWLKAVHSRRGA